MISEVASHYGLSSLHPEIAEHGGLWKWAKANPTKATLLGGVVVTGALTDRGGEGSPAQQFHSIVQPHQFSGVQGGGV